MTPGARSARGALSALLIVLACVLAPLGTLATRALHEIGATDTYVATMAPLADDRAVRHAVADAVTDAVMTEVDPGPMQSAVKEFVHEAVQSFTGTPAFATAWNTANRAAHDAVLQALRSDSDDAVGIDLAPITEQVKRRLVADGVAFAARIPVTHTEVTVLPQGDAASLRKGFHMLQVTGSWLPVAAVVLAVGGILLALRRRRAVTATALGLALGAGLLAGAIAVGRRIALDDLAPDVSRDAAGAVYDTLTASLRTAAWIILVTGAAVALAAWAVGLFVRRRRAPAAGGPEAVPAPSRARA